MYDATRSFEAVMSAEELPVDVRELAPVPDVWMQCPFDKLAGLIMERVLDKHELLARELGIPHSSDIALPDAAEVGHMMTVFHQQYGLALADTEREDAVKTMAIIQQQKSTHGLRETKRRLYRAMRDLGAESVLDTLMPARHSCHVCGGVTWTMTLSPPTVAADDFTGAKPASPPARWLTCPYEQLAVAIVGNLMDKYDVLARHLGMNDALISSVVAQKPSLQGKTMAIIANRRARWGANETKNKLYSAVYAMGLHTKVLGCI